MSCFGCCPEDDMQKTADNGPSMTHHAAGVFIKEFSKLLVTIPTKYCKNSSLTQF